MHPPFIEYRRKYPRHHQVQRVECIPNPIVKHDTVTSEWRHLPAFLEGPGHKRYLLIEAGLDGIDVVKPDLPTKRIRSAAGNEGLSIFFEQAHVYDPRLLLLGHADLKRRR